MEGETHVLSIAKQEEIVTQMYICPECSALNVLHGWKVGEKDGFCFETIPQSRYISEEGVYMPGLSCSK